MSAVETARLEVARCEEAVRLAVAATDDPRQAERITWYRAALAEAQDVLAAAPAHWTVRIGEKVTAALRPQLGGAIGR
jgi:hypothetical protein